MSLILQLRLATVALILVPSLGFSQTCLNTFSWLWWDNLAYDTDLTLGPGNHPRTYAYSISQAAPVYTATSLDVGSGPNGEGEVRFYNGIYGSGVVYAYARTWSGSTECTTFNGVSSVDANTCNGSTNRADTGWVVYNDFWTASLSVGALQRVTTHEVGHVFGLGHIPTSCSSVMDVNPITSGFSSLSSDEVNFLNSTY